MKAEEGTKMNTIEKYDDAALCDAILRKNFTAVGREFIDDKVTALRPFAFNNCTTIDTIDCANATVIGRQALSGCRATSVTLPWNRITSIDYRAFYGTAAASANPCRQEHLSLDALVSLCDQAFSNAGDYAMTTALKSVSAAVLESLPSGAFHCQNGLETASFPSVRLAASSAFEGCTALKTVTIGGAIASIPAKMFYGCSSLETLTLSGIIAVPTVANANAFDGVTGLTVKVPAALVADFQNSSAWSGFNITSL